MNKTLRVTLDIIVKPLDDEQLAEANEGMPDDCQMTAKDAMTDADEGDLADMVVGLFHEESVREAFAGSNIFVTFESDPTIVSAEFVEE